MASPPPERGGLRRLLLPRDLASSSNPAAERKPLIPSPPSPPPGAPVRKKGIASAAFRGLGCASAAASQAFSPEAQVEAAGRSSSDWQGKPRRRRRRGKDRKDRRVGGGGEVWCAPGMPFAAQASVDCVVAHHPMVGRPRVEAERARSERPSSSRRVTMQEQIFSFIDSPSNLGSTFFGSDPIPSSHLRHIRTYPHSPGGLEEEIMMFHTQVLLGSMDVYDRHQDWRLDVDNMSYEELLELGDRIGYVSTGLREDEIVRNLRKVKHLAIDSPLHLSTERERKCSICQEEYEANEEMGKLECGHSYHVYCIKQWLSQKNACPVCKTALPKR